MPRALITGIGGQDGSYLAELLLDQGYAVHGTLRPGVRAADSRLGHLLDRPGLLDHRLFLHPADLRDRAALREVLVRVTPEEIYHLAGQSHVGRSYARVEETCDMDALSTLRLLEVVRDSRPPPRLFHASSSEIFGRPETAPQDERTPYGPVTPYGCAKAFATQMVKIYREDFGLFACNGILYNHESPRRGTEFVTRKICLAAAAIKEGRQQELMLGNLTAERDWGDARDYVRGMWRCLQHSSPEDFVFATGELHTVGEVVAIAFGAVGLDWRRYVRQDPGLLRPSEPVRLVGNPAKAVRLLGWERTTTFEQLISEMTLAARTCGDGGGVAG